MDTNNIPVVTLSTQDDAKLLQQLKSGFKGKIQWDKCLLKVTLEVQSQYLDCLIDPSFQGARDFLCYHLRIFSAKGGNKILQHQQ